MPKPQFSKYKPYSYSGRSAHYYSFYGKKAAIGPSITAWQARALRKKEEEEGWMYYNAAGGPFYSKSAANKALFAFNRRAALARRSNLPYSHPYNIAKRKAFAKKKLYTKRYNANVRQNRSTQPTGVYKGYRGRVYKSYTKEHSLKKGQVLQQIHNLDPSIVMEELEHMSLHNLQNYLISMRRFASKRKISKLNELSGA